MAKMPAVTKLGATAARVSVGTALALCAYQVPEVAIALPVVTMLLEHTFERPKRLLAEALARRQVLDLSDEQAVAFVQMANRYFFAARQGEFDHNLRLLAAFLTCHLKSDACEPGSFLDMTRRVEGLSKTSLHAIALIGEFENWQPDGSIPEALTLGLVCDANKFTHAMNVADAPDAFTDLIGRGLLNVSVQESIGATQQCFHSTKALRELTARALEVAQSETRPQ